MSYRIGTFNVRNLSASAGSSRDLDRIADIIKRFDIIALQEVLSEGKILTGMSLNDAAGQAKAYEYSLKSRLGENWDMCWLDPQTSSKWYPYIGGDSRGEGYAFLWRKDKFTLPKNTQGKAVVPRIIHQYRVNSSEGEFRLIRDPAYGRFQPVNMRNMEIRLITTHIVFSKPNADNFAKGNNQGAYRMRLNEFRVLARSIYTSVSEDHTDTDCVVPYTIILGDYNMNLPESGAGCPFVPSVMVFDKQKMELRTSVEMNEFGFYFIHTGQTDLSTVKRDEEQYANNYDHFSYDEHTQNVIKGRPRRLDSVVEQAGGFRNYREKVSDHIPVMVEISLK